MAQVYWCPNSPETVSYVIPHQPRQELHHYAPRDASQHPVRRAVSVRSRRGGGCDTVGGLGGSVSGIARGRANGIAGSLGASVGIHA